MELRLKNSTISPGLVSADTTSLSFQQQQKYILIHQMEKLPEYHTTPTTHFSRYDFPILEHIHWASGCLFLQNRMKRWNTKREI